MRWIFLLVITVTCCSCQSFVSEGYEEVSTQGKDTFSAYDKCGEGKSAGKKVCVPYHKCDPATNTVVEESVNTDGHGLIDIRFREDELCPHYLDVCCNTPDGSSASTATPDPSPSPIPTPDPSPYPSPSPVPTPSPKPDEKCSYCGIRNDNGITFKITGQSDREAEFGEFPWMVAILKHNSESKPMAICGGSLITPKVVLTGAHCVYMYKSSDLVVRAGEWDTQTDKELYPYQERGADKIIIHEKFNPKNLFNDVALIVLKTPLKAAEHIGTICLPEEGEVVISNSCYTTGWGKDVFGQTGRYQSILKKMELPIVPRKPCEENLRATRLGKNFVLDSSFMCAGGELGRDACTGDGGSPLVCPDPKNPSRYLQVGIVAWGIGCGESYPGVYADVTKFRSWVDINMQRMGLRTDPYEI